MKYFIVAFMALAICRSALAKINFPEPIDCETTYSKVEDHVHQSLPTDFFVVNMTTSISINTNAPAVIYDYQAIRKKYPKNMLILIVVSDEAGSLSKGLDSYLKNNFNLDTKKDQYLVAIENDSLYKKLQSKKNFSTILYFHNKCLYFNTDCKLSSVEDHFFPTSRFKFEPKPDAILDDSEFPQSLINYTCSVDDSLFVCVTDFKCRTNLVNARTGKVFKTLDLTTFDAPKLYAKYIARSRKEANFARQNDSALKRINRDEVAFEICKRVNDKIYFTGSIQVVTKSRKPYAYISDYGLADTIPKGTVSAPYYHFILTTDLNLENPVFYFPKANPFPKKDNEVLEECANFGFTINDEGNLLALNFPKSTIMAQEDRMHEVSNLPAFSEWKFTKSGRLKFVGHKPGKHLENLPQMHMGIQVANVYKAREKFYFNYDVCKYQFSLSGKDPMDSLIGTGKPDVPEVFISYSMDSDTPVYNYQLLTQGPLFNNKYYCFVYENRGDVVCEIRNKDFEVIQIQNISHLQNMNDVVADYYMGNVFLMNNQLTYLTLEGDKKIHINRYSIELD